jgi:hypothetical protein
MPTVLTESDAESLILLAIQQASAQAKAPVAWTSVAALLSVEQWHLALNLRPERLLEKLERSELIRLVAGRSGLPGWELTERGRAVLAEAGAPDPALMAVICKPHHRSRPSALALRSA